MPPIQQQQTSRAGLITSLVISIMVALGLLVWAIMTNSELTKARADKDRTVKASQQIYVEGPELEALRQLKADPAYAAAPTLLDIANRQTQEVVKVVVGDGKGVKDVRADVATVQDKLAKAKAGVLKDVQVGGDPITLTTTIETLLGKIEADAAAVKSANDKVAAADAAARAEKDKLDAEIATLKTAVATAQAATGAEKARADKEIAAKQAQVDEFSKSVDDTKKTLNDAQVAQQAEQQKLEAEIKKLTSDKQKLMDLLARYRPNVKEAVVRNVDCLITQLAENNTCYIDLGFGDHVVPGLTFEVYDKLEGVPPLAAGTSNFELPKGKASLEIIEVGQNSSRCRVTQLRQGQILSQGDKCANIVYDKNIKPLFYLYGSFDMDNNGVFTPGEAEIIKGLINRWGGRVTDKLGPEVDFMIIGKEPVVPLYTPEEKQNPVINARYEAAVKESKEYNDVLNKAGEYHIPIMNQNRFLYYTGYFDASKK